MPSHEDIVLHRNRDGEVTLVGQWPRRSMISRAYKGTEMTLLPEGGPFDTSLDRLGHQFLIEVANGRAEYRAVGYDEREDAWIVELIVEDLAPVKWEDSVAWCPFCSRALHGDGDCFRCLTCWVWWSDPTGPGERMHP